MSQRAADRESCRKRGIVLTCYVDGHKRFRMLPWTAFTDDATSDEDETPFIGDLPATIHRPAVPAKVARTH